MSIRNSKSIQCPGCGHTQDFGIWPSLNVTLDPEEKERLLNGELTRFVCARCQSSREVRYPMLYHDMDRRLMVHSASPGKDIAGLEMFAKLMSTYQLRSVANHNELLEKVWIAEAGFDDRAMELFKLTVQNQMRKDGEFCFAGVRRDEERELLSFVLMSAGANESILVPRESYTEFSDGIADILELEPVALGLWHAINRAYAQSLIPKYLSGGDDRNP